MEVESNDEEVTGTEDESDEAPEENDDIFSMMWPIVMALVTVGVFIAILVVVCRKLCNRGNRSSSSSNGRSQNHRESTVGTENRGIQPPNGSSEDFIWSVSLVESGVDPDSTPADIIHMKPPPYCENPPDYEEVALAVRYWKPDNVEISRGAEINSEIGDHHSYMHVQASQATTSDSPPAYTETQSRDTTHDAHTGENQTNHTGAVTDDVIAGDDVTLVNDVNVH